MGAVRGLAAGGPGSLAALHVDQHPLGHNDRVVDQHAHVDAKRSQGYPLHLDAEDAHQEERAEDGERERDADDDADPQPHEQAKRGDDDGDRGQEAEDEAVDRPIDHDVLLGDRVDLDAQRDARRNRVEMRLHGPTDLDDVERRDAGRR